MNAREMIEQEMSDSERNEVRSFPHTSAGSYVSAAERVIERLNTRLRAMMEGYDARGVLIDHQEAAIDTKDALIADREREIACHKAELAAAREENCRLHWEANARIACRRRYGAELSAMTERAEAAEARCKVLASKLNAIRRVASE